LPHGGLALALEQPPLGFFLRGHVASDDLHVGIGPFFADHAGTYMEEPPIRAGRLQMDLEGFHDRPVVEEIAEILTGALELPRWQQFADVDPPEGRGILDADQHSSGGIHFEDRATSVDQERPIRGDLEQLAEPGLRSTDELLRPLPLRDVPCDRRASDQAARAVSEWGHGQGDHVLASVLPEPHGFEELELLAVPEPRHASVELL